MKDHLKKGMGENFDLAYTVERRVGLQNHPTKRGVRGVPRPV